MRLVSYDRSGIRRLAAWVGDLIVDLPDAVGHPAFPGTLESLLARNGGTTLEAARAALEYPGALKEFSVPRPRMLAPLALSENAIVQMLEPGEPLPFPPRGMELVCRPELAGIVGRAAEGIDEEQAVGTLFGYTLVNAWHVRRPGERELMPIGVAVGPCVVTADEFDPSRRMAAVSVDGASLRETRLGPKVAGRFARTLAAASRNGGLRPGEIYGFQLFPSPIAIAVGARKRNGAGDTIIAVEIPGIGRLESSVRRR
jgi:2-keto-4-pentenoate hydratase/2-oxohepta-3-ene-1,7-dioic acid hydratase in catechol pathway